MDTNHGLLGRHLDMLVNDLHHLLAFPPVTIQSFKLAREGVRQFRGVTHVHVTGLRTIAPRGWRASGIPSP